MTELSPRKRFGLVDDDRQRAMSGLEFVQGLVDGTLPLNTMAQTLGYDVVEVSKGRVVAAAEPHAGHLNPAGTVHGGLAATLLDTCMGLAIRSMLDKGFRKQRSSSRFRLFGLSPRRPAS
jgi:acyl-coenzyme A thioesterase PaaI-like protein